MNETLNEKVFITFTGVSKEINETIRELATIEWSYTKKEITVSILNNDKIFDLLFELVKKNKQNLIVKYMALDGAGIVTNYSDPKYMVSFENIELNTHYTRADNSMVVYTPQGNNNPSRHYFRCTFNDIDNKNIMMALL